MAVSLAILLAGGGLSQPGRPATPEGAGPEGAGPASSRQEYDHHGSVRRLPETVLFNAHIRPVMSNTCFVCHGPDDGKNDSGLRLDSRNGAVDEGAAIEPGNAIASAVFQRIMDADDPMPPAEYRHQLSDYEKALIAKWIEQGAEYQQHWSWAPLQRPAVPAVQHHQDRIVNPIDAFVLSRLEAEGIEPSPLADKATGLRRLCLDLTGLPPQWEEVSAFLADDAPDAWQRQVERLLASPHYGERMAARWLDIAGFSDTVGFHGDQNQRIFPYRDYVIRSVNNNQPFDEFTREQLAGDLLDHPGDAQLVATGLIRLNMMTREGGAQPAEYLAKYTAERVRMIGTAWLGATTGCCECHNHKYDPFTIEDFYSLGAFFDDVRQWGVYSDYGYTPNPELQGFTNDHPFPPEMRVASESLDAQIGYLEKRLDETAARLTVNPAVDAREFRDWLEQLVASYRIQPDLWISAPPVEVAVAGGEAWQLLDDGSILFTGQPPTDQIVDLQLRAAQPTMVRSLRMEVIPDKTHDGRVGRAAEGRFSAQWSVTCQPDVDRPDNQPEPMITVRPRYVRIELDGPKILSLAEVQVFAPGDDGVETNIAPAATASQSSTDHDGPATLAIDGNPDGDYHNARSTTHTRQEPDPWWELDLGSARQINRIQIWNRTDGDYAKRLAGFRLVLLDEDRQPVWRQTPDVAGPATELVVPEEVAERELRLPVPVAMVQADRSTPNRYSSGQPPRYIEGTWRSGPAVWQLPVDETRLRHTAVVHLNEPLWLRPQDRLVVALRSSDVGRLRFAVSPVSRMVAGRAAVSEPLHAALDQLASGRSFGELTGPAASAIRSAWYQYQTPISRQDPRIVALRDSIADCRSGLAMTMVCQSTGEAGMRRSRVLPRGNWQDESGPPVVPNTPHFLAGYQSSPPRRLTRLDLADWLTSRDNPLVARHYVNRIWKHFFGRGLSGNLDDLGNQGEWPSHPLLMDWLASEFQENWDRKQIVRLIVNSSTYRQQAAVRRDLADIDPYNRLLAQQSARRLEAEIVRDNALAIAGLLLTDWIGGPSVFPEQPAGHYANLQFPNRRYAADTDGRQYRRGVYMHWQRTFLHPMLTNFDAPARDECAADRTLSNSPQQALTLLNDPVFVEASRALAGRLLRDKPGGDFRQWVTAAFRMALSRDPDPRERESLEKLYAVQRDYFATHPDEAELFEHNGAWIADPGVPHPERAALAQVCRVILNLHETITRY